MYYDSFLNTKTHNFLITGNVGTIIPSEQANTDNVEPGSEQEYNRELLLKVMTSAKFVNYASEWWHFTLENEPYPDSYFDFPIQQECPHSAS
jgi:hypothetical protein